MGFLGARVLSRPSVGIQSVFDPDWYEFYPGTQSAFKEFLTQMGIGPKTL